MIFTNLEYAQNAAANHSTSVLLRATTAVRWCARMPLSVNESSATDVARINRIIRARAKQYIAAGRKEWLHPDQTEVWGDLRHVLMPPKHELYRFGGEMFAKFEDGSVHYQDAFGRTEKQNDILQKLAPAKPLRSKDPCGCGNGRTFGECCESKPAELRPRLGRTQHPRTHHVPHRAGQPWTFSTRIESWIAVRRELTDEKITLIFSCLAICGLKTPTSCVCCQNPMENARCLHRHYPP